MTIDEVRRKISSGEVRTAYFVLPTQRSDDGQLIALIAVEDHSGFYRTDWLWGRDLDVAEQIAREKNKALGISEEEAIRIQLSTMRRIEKKHDFGLPGYKKRIKKEGGK